ncbi:MAG TPA: hypothetical protein VLK37_09985 [Solirubrobacterales bacterium]|nr:hypothetical protein [Solirubrobacterales bacterium]
MNKKLMLLVVGALTALAFTALPGAASAKETALKCEKAPCTFEVSGGVSEFSTAGGDTVKCESVTGSGGAINLNAENETTTTTVQLLFHGCKEQATIFHFACSNTATSGTVTTDPITGHLIALPEAASGNGVLLTDQHTTFTCAGGFARTTVTGSVIGENEAKCGEPASTDQKLDFKATAHGQQKFKTWTGNTYDLIAATNHIQTGSGTTTGYETASQTGTGTLTWNTKVQVTCAT